MKTGRITLLAAVFMMATVLLMSTNALVADGTKPEENTCITCHGDPELWEGDNLRLHITEKNLTTDIHWTKGLRCQDCHGGDSTSFDVREAHAKENGFNTLKSLSPGVYERISFSAYFLKKNSAKAELGMRSSVYFSFNFL